MSWYSEGNEGAEQLTAATSNFKKRRNFFTIDGEPAAKIRFLKPAQESFNYQRSFIKQAPKGMEKLQTSYGTPDCPLVKSPKQTLQAAFAWPVIDRRVLKFKDRQSGEDKEVGPRIMYFADGVRTRKQLIAFEKEMLANKNEERAEEGLDPLTLPEYNLTSYDLKVTKPKGAQWIIMQVREKDLTKADRELIEKEPITLHEELAPLPKDQLQAILGGGAVEEEAAETTAYSYDTDDDDTIDFSDDE